MGGGNGNGWQFEMMYTLDTNGGGFAVAIDNENTGNDNISSDVLRCERTEKRPTQRRPVHHGEPPCITDGDMRGEPSSDSGEP